MATIDDLFSKISSIEALILGLRDKMVVPSSLVITEGLSDISNALGLVEAGEFRSGNRSQPGEGFSGVRIVYPPVNYGGSLYNIAGVDADTLMVGIRSSDGALIAGAGGVLINDGGIRFPNGVGDNFITWEDTGSSGAAFISYAGDGVAGTDDALGITLGKEGLDFLVYLTMTDLTTPYLSWGEDPAVTNRALLSVPIAAQGSKISFNNLIELNAQGDSGGQTYLKIAESSDTPTSLGANEVRMYYRTGKIIFQVYSTGDTQEDLYFYATLSSTAVSSDWVLSTDAQ